MEVIFEIRQSISAFIQILGWNVSERKLIIEFPDGNLLTFDEASETFPQDFPLEPGVFNEDDHDILADLDEWGFYEENVLYLDIDTLNSDVELNPPMFTNSSGEEIPFDYSVFPTGIYKLTMNLTEGENSYSQRFFVSSSFDQALVAAVNQYFSSESRVLRETLYLNIIEKIIVKEAALIDFNNNRFNEANRKLQALDQSEINVNLDYNYFVK